MGYTTDLTLEQRNFILEKFPEIFNTKSKADMLEVLNALFFLEPVPQYLLMLGSHISE